MSGLAILGDLIPSIGKVLGGIGGAVAKDPLGAIGALASTVLPFFLDDDDIPMDGGVMRAPAMSAGNSMMPADPATTMAKVQMMAAQGNTAAQALLAAVAGGAGGSAGPVDCPSLFRQGNRSTYMPSRQQVRGPDGRVYVIANLGLATHGSREKSVMKQLASSNGYVTRRRHSGGR